jgi:hypothetical protein
VDDGVEARIEAVGASERRVDQFAGGDLPGADQFRQAESVVPGVVQRVDRVGDAGI